mmetsp:Transcript_1554/g.5618  ORF Transcript_1554/g.5618 Transcript_1554/m.5618 type:complete len:208 (-) Transcript_1554:1380-2003(-)
MAVCMERSPSPAFANLFLLRCALSAILIARIFASLLAKPAPGSGTSLTRRATDFDRDLDVRIFFSSPPASPSFMLTSPVERPRLTTRRDAERERARSTAAVASRPMDSRPAFMLFVFNLRCASTLRGTTGLLFPAAFLRLCSATSLLRRARTSPRSAFSSSSNSSSMGARSMRSASHCASSSSSSRSSSASLASISGSIKSATFLPL